MQALEPTDFLLRIIYCEWLLQQCRDRPNFLNCILFTDEVGFARNAVFHNHNTHIWSDENPLARQEVRFQRQFAINVWPLSWTLCFTKQTKRAHYLEFLNNVLEEHLDVKVPLGERVLMWYLNDGAPPHFDRPVTEWLNNHFPNHWVGRNGPVVWSPRSSDLNQCDFCLWGWIKQFLM